MAIQFDCVHCGFEFRAPERLAGSQCRCKGCGQVVTVPGAAQREAASASPQPRGPQNPPGLPKPQAEPGGVAPGAWIVLGIGGVIAFLGIVAVTILPGLR